MKNKIFIVTFFLTFSSCSIFQKTQTVSQNIESANIESEDSIQKFIGVYDIKVFGTPEGDLELKINVSKDGDGLKSSFESEEVANAFDITGTEIDQGILYIDIYVSSYGVNIAFEIYVEGNQVSGYLADMFELEGTISN
tara:strand:+ start:2449 stop:2865 length:417 start_codon:yes stop_codon:yes gene_type:complete